MAQQTVLITGASSGIGKAAAKRLAQKGNRVFGTARHPENASDLAGEAKANGWDLTLLSMDVRDDASVRAGLASAARTASSTVIAGPSPPS